MRKKLFAVIMSAMMMITFMPAMAFAASDFSPVSGAGKYAVSDVTDWADPVDNYNIPAAFIYDGKDHTITFGAADAYNNYGHKVANAADVTVQYNLGTFDNVTKHDYVFAGWTETAPVIKNVGQYKVDVRAKYTDAYSHDTMYGQFENHWGLQVKILPRPVAVNAGRQLAVTKVYDGEGFVLTDKDFAITGVDAGTNYANLSDVVVTTNKAWWNRNSGLVAGDTLLTGAFKTGADVGTYYVWAELNPANGKEVNANYSVVGYKAGETLGAAVLTITKAENTAKIASNTLTIKRGSSKPVKFSADFGTAKLTKVSTGNTKISVKSGKIKVAKSCKKGTYKIKVKASAAGTKNWTSASRTKTLIIKVK